MCRTILQEDRVLEVVAAMVLVEQMAVMAVLRTITEFPRKRKLYRSPRDR